MCFIKNNNNNNMIDDEMMMMVCMMYASGCLRTSQIHMRAGVASTDRYP